MMTDTARKAAEEPILPILDLNKKFGFPPATPKERATLVQQFAEVIQLRALDALAAEKDKRISELERDRERLEWALTKGAVYCRDDRGLIDRKLNDRNEIDAARHQTDERG